MEPVRVNFLAHSLFAGTDPELLAGQFCGDFVRGPDLSAWSPGIAAGIRRHRQIDAYTDRHPQVLAARGLLPPACRRFSGIMLDVMFDHFIARDWSRHASVTLASHTAFVHAALAEHQQVLPEALQRFAGFLRRDAILEGFVEFQTVSDTLERLAQRSPRWQPMLDGIEPLARADSAIEPLFDRFFVDLQREMRPGGISDDFASLDAGVTRR